MNMTTKSVFFALLAVICCLALASAQQQLVVPQSLAAGGQIGAQQAPAAPATNCTTVTTKPSPTVAKYSIEPTDCTLLQFAGYLTVSPVQYIELNDGQVDYNVSMCPAVNTGPSKIAINFACAQLVFNINTSTNNSQVFVNSISGFYNLNGTQFYFNNDTTLFATSQENHYYKCNAVQTVFLKPTGLPPTAPTTLIAMEVSNFALETYRDKNSTEFYKAAEDCVLDSQPVSDLVRIGVGVCLVALVAIVLVAYFVGRRRWSGRSSYESV